jgi:hypothetical protein
MLSYQPSARDGYTTRCLGIAPTSIPSCGLHGFRDDDNCECVAKETVAHVILNCPKLRIAQEILCRESGEAFSDISTMLGGNRKTSHVKAVLDFAEASQWFHSRGPKDPEGQNRRQMVNIGP